MKALIIPAALAVLLATPASAETRGLSGFDQVSASGGYEVEITFGPQFSVDVEGPGAADVVTRVSGRRLIVEPVRTWGFHWGSRRRAAVRVSMPSVSGLDASSGAEINASGLDADALALDASSGAHLRIAGSCRTLSVDASSGSVISAQDLRCNEATVDVSSGARTSVSVDGVLNVDASSGGEVNASGDPRIGDISLSSGGALHRR